MVDNQHQKISGYRDLDQSEIDLMNEVKAWEHQGRDLMNRISVKIGETNAALTDKDERKAFEYAEPSRWLAIGKTHIQQGCMAIVRAIARPST